MNRTGDDTHLGGEDIGNCVVTSQVEVGVPAVLCVPCRFPAVFIVFKDSQGPQRFLGSPGAGVFIIIIIIISIRASMVLS